MDLILLQKNLCNCDVSVPPMKDDGLKTSVNHPATEMSAQVFLILSTPLIQSIAKRLTSSEPCMD